MTLVSTPFMFYAPIAFFDGFFHLLKRLGLAGKGSFI